MDDPLMFKPKKPRLLDTVTEHVGEWLAIYIIGLVLVALCVLMFIAKLQENRRYREVTLPQAYSAWCKHTGNPGGVTIEEFESLMKMNQPEKTDSTTVVPVIIQTP